jgi:hypothetical protein
VSELSPAVRAFALEPFAEAALDLVLGIARVGLEAVAEPSASPRSLGLVLQTFAEATDVSLRGRARPLAHPFVEAVFDLLRGSRVFAFWSHD